MFMKFSRIASLLVMIIGCSTAAAVPVSYDYTVHFDAGTRNGVLYSANDFGFTAASLLGPSGPCYGASSTPLRTFNYVSDATPAAGAAAGGLSITRVNGGSYGFDAACNLSRQGFTAGDQHSFDNVGGPAALAPGGINAFLWWLDSNTGSPLDVGSYASNEFYREVSDGSNYFYVIGAGTMNITQRIVSEPATLALFGFGVIALLLVRGRHRKMTA